MIASGCKSLFKAPGQHRTFLFLAVLLLLFYTSTGKYITHDQFDYLIFSQRWLPTACIEYVEHRFSPNIKYQCIKPKNFEFWAVHGLWPTQKNHIGPFFCNRSMAFDINKLKSIEPELELDWPNIEAKKNLTSLWQHEWDKHGTCATELKSLNTELKYFSTALKLFKLFAVQNLLKKNSIIPVVGRGINITDLFSIFKNGFGKLPQIHCFFDVKTKRPYLSEIRLCFNKNFELMDCNGISNSELNDNMEMKNILSNCPITSEVIYPKGVNSELKLLLKNSLNMHYYDSLEYMLNIIRFFQWAFI